MFHTDMLLFLELGRGTGALYIQLLVAVVAVVVVAVVVVVVVIPFYSQVSDW